MTKTLYRVLAQSEDGCLSAVGEYEANAGDQAIRAGAKTLPPETLTSGIVMVAVPDSNWTEEHVKIVVAEPRIVVGGRQTTIEEALPVEDEGDEIPAPDEVAA